MHPHTCLYIHFGTCTLGDKGVPYSPSRVPPPSRCTVYAFRVLLKEGIVDHVLCMLSCVGVREENGGGLRGVWSVLSDGESDEVSCQPCWQVRQLQPVRWFQCRVHGPDTVPSRPGPKLRVQRRVRESLPWPVSLAPYCLDIDVVCVEVRSNPLELAGLTSAVRRLGTVRHGSTAVRKDGARGVELASTRILY